MQGYNKGTNSKRTLSPSQFKQRTSGDISPIVRVTPPIAVHHLLPRYTATSWPRTLTFHVFEHRGGVVGVWGDAMIVPDGGKRQSAAAFKSDTQKWRNGLLLFFGLCGGKSSLLKGGRQIPCIRRIPIVLNNFQLNSPPPIVTVIEFSGNRDVFLVYLSPPTVNDILACISVERWWNSLNFTFLEADSPNIHTSGFISNACMRNQHHVIHSRLSTLYNLSFPRQQQRRQGLTHSQNVKRVFLPDSIGSFERWVLLSITN
ncbi:8709_t:CDS:2 [Acaulospora morrowiae]|uniref:8709_t:CDS:1 n=1 Tax=Acaulospora morrowiae TaxID=94023 RepID=A0A9N8VMV3_9GLOM|nr:8709_t:CDS:2 [Acaulospora morrowiae]